MALGQRAVGREVGERLRLTGSVPVESGLPLEACEDRFQRFHLELEDSVAIDEAPANWTPRVKKIWPIGAEVESGAYAVQPSANAPPGASNLQAPNGPVTGVQVPSGK